MAYETVRMVFEKKNSNHNNNKPNKAEIEVRLNVSWGY